MFACFRSLRVYLAVVGKRAKIVGENSDLYGLICHVNRLAGEGKEIAVDTLLSACLYTRRAAFSFVLQIANPFSGAIKAMAIQTSCFCHGRQHCEQHADKRRYKP